MQKIKIGVLAYRMDFYTNLRIIINQLPEADYVPVRDLFSIRRALALKLNRVIGKPLFPTFDLNNQFEDGKYLTNRQFVKLTVPITVCILPYFET